MKSRAAERGKGQVLARSQWRDGLPTTGPEGGQTGAPRPPRTQGRGCFCGVLRRALKPLSSLIN